MSLSMSMCSSKEDYERRITEEVAAESVIELTECQKAIETFPDQEDDGICGFCKKANVHFWDQVYLSKTNITETCKRNCCHAEGYIPVI